MIIEVNDRISLVIPMRALIGLVIALPFMGIALMLRFLYFCVSNVYYVLMVTLNYFINNIVGEQAQVVEKAN